MIQNWLQHLAEKDADKPLAPNWSTFDLARFSPEKTLWNYQQEALRLALTVLHRYYEAEIDYHPGEADDVDELRKAALEEWYREELHLTREQRASVNVPLAGAKRALREMIAEFLPVDEEAPVLDFKQLCNRMGFYMATGSGKTLVLVKLLELLHALMQRQEIPACDVLILTHREDLIAQLQRTVSEYNHAPGAAMQIEVRELREYAEAKRDAPGGLLGRDATLRVFFYRSDNLRDEHKEAVVDFRNYDNDGRWYVLLDEAHKGDAAEAKRKHIVSIMSRRGFLFNFSATFIDALDLRTTVFNYNLPAFIEGGFGKHIAVLKQELAAFKTRGGGDYTEDEKKKVVAKSLLLLAYTAGRVRELRAETGQPALYHHPMLLALVNSVNTEDADLKLYFRQIRAIALGQVPDKVWTEAKDELWEELKDKPEFLFENPRAVEIAKADLMKLGPKDVWRDVFNAPAQSDIEVLARPGNRKELAFQMKSAERPFALIKIGDTDAWRREFLEGFAFHETLETESFFDGLNAPDSPFNILMGSRTFHEGWDSNRPNVITFVNIGGDDARKFIMQSVGRGVRVQSWGGARRRFEALRDEFPDRELFRRLSPKTVAPETLYVLGTNRDALQTVLRELQAEKPEQALLGMMVNPRAAERLLLVPEYRLSRTAIIEEREPKKFAMLKDDRELLERYSRALSPELLLLAHGGTPERIGQVRQSLAEPEKHYDGQGAREYRDVGVMVQRAMTWFSGHASEVEGVRALDVADIVHFTKITVARERAEDVQRKVDRVLRSKTPEGKQEAEAVWKEVEQMDLDLSEKADAVARLMEERELKPKQTYKDELTVEYLEEHYYLPVLYATKGKRLEYIRHIIDEPSESTFLAEVIAGRKELAALDWWMFSKIDHTADAVSIPYYDPRTGNTSAAFYPDFVFWGQRGNAYTIAFVDPKGMEHSAYQHKLDGFNRLFEDGEQPRHFNHEGLDVCVRLFLFNRGANSAPDGYKRFWRGSAKEIFAEAFRS